MTVIRPAFGSEWVAFDALTDEQFHDAWERPVLEAVAAISAAVEAGERRIVVVLPAASSVEVAGLAHVAAAVEAVRITALSAAAANAARGITVNVVTVVSAGDDPDPGVLGFLSGDASAAVTGQTIRVVGVSARLDGRMAIVTGAGSGIGEAVARELAARGATVVVASRRPDNGEPVAEAIRAAGGAAVCLPTDVTDSAAVDACVAEAIDSFGGVDIVVHNALKSGDGADTHGLTAADVDRVWEPMSRTSMWALLNLARAAGAALRASGPNGRLIVTSSAAGITGTPYRPLYAAVKAGQRALVKALAREWGPAGVTVNAIAPLAATSGLLEAFERTPAVRESIEARSALGRVGTPADVAAVVGFLASDDAGYLSGQTLVCDGGWFTGL